MIKYLRNLVLKAQLESGTYPNQEIQATLIPTEIPEDCIGHCSYSGLPITSQDNYLKDNRGRIYLTEQIKRK